MAAVPLPTAGYFNTVITNAQAKNAQDAVLAFLRQSIPGASALGNLTIASDGITPAGSTATMTVDTESGAATDNLSTIVQTNTTDGQIILISQVSDSRLVTVKHGIGGSGQILLRGDVDMNLNSETYLWLMRQGTNWVEVNRTASSPMNINVGTAGGTANALTGTPNISIPAYRTDMTFTIIPISVNTNATVTINLGGLGNKNVKKYIGSGKVSLGVGDIQTGSPMSIYYDGTDLIWLDAPTYSHGADIASSGTVNLNAATGDCVDITGTTAITAITLNEGVERTIRFTGALTLTHGSSLVLPGATNIITVAGDYAILRGYASGVVRCVSYQRSSVSPGSSDVKIQDFRLTLTTGVPVTTSDVTGATTMYCTPYRGNNIALFDGAKWNMRTSAQFSLALGTLTSGLPYDVFCYDNGGTPTLEFTAWTNDTTRNTALVYQDGVLVKSGNSTRRYLGSFYTTSTTATEDSLVKRFLYNYYNRIARPMKRVDPAVTWNYTLSTYRQANGNTANQLDFIQGVAEDLVSARVVSEVRNTSAGTLLAVGIGVDGVAANAGLNAQARCPAPSYEIQLTAFYDAIPGLGRHFLTWMESSGVAGTTTWVGDQTSFQCGIAGHVMA